MQQFKMKPFSAKPDFTVTVPGSKSMTNRALLMAALAEGKSRLQGVLFSDDSRVFMEALRTLGYPLVADEENAVVEMEGYGKEIPKKKASVYVGSAGTAARFLTAMLALSGGTYEVESSEQMKVRPMRPLLEALEMLGAEFEYREKPYAFPFVILGRKKEKNREIPLNIDKSSQFLSALLLTGILSEEGYRIRLTGNRNAKSYVRISMKMMEEFDCHMRVLEENLYEIIPGEHYRAGEYRIEPDVSAACYFYAMAAVNGGRVKVRHVHRDSTQGDIHFLDILEKMGCSCREEEDGIVLTGPADGRLAGADVVMSDFSDQTMTLAAIAPFATSPVTIRGVAHIRGQESDRIHGMVTELSRMGISCEEYEDGLRIEPGEVKSTLVHTYEDHRMAMAFAITGTKTQGIVIDNPACCAKTFEGYFDVLTNLNLRLE